MEEMVETPAALTPESRYILQETKLAQCMPDDARRELDEILMRKPGARPSVNQLWKDMQLKERYRVSRETLREYARRVRALAARAMCGRVSKVLARLMAMPIDQTEELMDGGQILALSRMLEVLEEQNLAPEQLMKVAEALSKQQAAVAKAHAQRFAELRFRAIVRAARKSKKSGSNWEKHFDERIRRIYGIDLSKSNLPKLPGELEDQEEQTG